jgi:hypothetical protein
MRLSLSTVSIPIGLFVCSAFGQGSGFVTAAGKTFMEGTMTPNMRQDFDRDMNYVGRDYNEWRPLNRRRRSDRAVEWISFVLVSMVTVIFFAELYVHGWK